MITITQLLTTAERIKADTDINEYVWVSDEGDLAKKLKNIKSSQFPLLVVVTPSYDSEAADSDNVSDINHILFFILKRGSFQSAKESSDIQDMDDLLELTTRIRGFLLNGFPDYQDCTFLNGIMPASFHIDPEVNYLGCKGYSMSFNIKTK